MNKWLKSLFWIGGLALWAFVYPRLLISSLGVDHPWASYLYMYANGSLFFLIGLYAILKTQACVLGRSYDSTWFGVLVVGLIAFSSAHATWIWLSLNTPFKG